MNEKKSAKERTNASSSMSHVLTREHRRRRRDGGESHELIETVEVVADRGRLNGRRSHGGPRVRGEGRRRALGRWQVGPRSRPSSPWFRRRIRRFLCGLVV